MFSAYAIREARNPLFFSIYLWPFYSIILFTWASLYFGVNAILELESERANVANALKLADTARLRALQSNLNPHFLFNALNGIATLIREHDSVTATAMVDDLGTFLRSTLECDRPFILIAEREHRLYPLQPRGIDYVESAGNYVKFHVDKLEYIARESIKRLEAVLGCAGFVRIERKLLLNISAISFVETVGSGAFAFALNNGVCLHSGPAYRETILQALPLRRRASGAGSEREPNSAAQPKVCVSKIPPSDRKQFTEPQGNLRQASPLTLRGPGYGMRGARGSNESER